jgi:rhamnosyltransferase
VPWRVCAIVVTFHPDVDFAGRLLRIASQVDGVVIVDNGSAPSIGSTLADLPGPRKPRLVENANNRGVAAALNQGIEHARAHGYTHVLLFDQDTEPSPHMVSSMQRIAGTQKDFHRVAVLGINFVDPARHGDGMRLGRANQDAVEVRAVITSGSLLPVRVVEELGPFREDLFIDLIDDEYCLRARSRGYKVLLVREPLALHSLGRAKVYRLPWRTIGTSNHSAVRRYYMMRNFVLLIREYGVREPGWVLSQLCTRLKSLLLLVCFDDNRVLKLRLLWRGLMDGISGRTGVFPADPCGGGNS